MMAFLPLYDSESWMLKKETNRRIAAQKGGFSFTHRQKLLIYIGFMKQKKTVYYNDPLNDDFAPSNGKIKTKPLPEKFKWVRKNPIWKFFALLLYYIIAIPFTWLFIKIAYDAKLVGKKKLGHRDLNGCFIYGNHTQNADAIFYQSLLMAPRKTYVVCSQETVNIPGIRWLVMMLGGIPIPKTVEETKKFVDCIAYRHKRGDGIVIFPEAHIWPYATVIRPFPDSSFTYPVKHNAPVLGACVTYRERKIFRFMPPRVLIHVSDVYYPDTSLPYKEQMSKLRDQVYEFMVNTASSLDNCEYVRYVRRTKEKDEDSKAEENNL